MTYIAHILEVLTERRIYLHNPKDYCHVGGSLNFAKVGHYGEIEENYGLPCVVEPGGTNCVFCGRGVE